MHKMSLILPKLELYEEGSQVRRSSKSVKSMILRVMEEEDTKLILSNTLSMLNLNEMKQ